MLHEIFITFNVLLTNLNFNMRNYKDPEEEEQEVQDGPGDPIPDDPIKG